MVITKDFNPSYVGQRPDIERLVPPGVKYVLDVGCSNGVVGEAIKAKTGAQVIGIELSPEMASEAAGRLDKVFAGDAGEIIQRGELDEYRFDAIIFADLLEHLADPWAVLRAAAARLQPEGVVIASIPNVRHIDTLCNLIVKGYWPYRERGIHDRTHLRFFTRKNIVELFQSAGLSIETMKANYRILEKPYRFNRYARVLALPGLKGFFAYQYVVRARLAKYPA